MTARGPDQSEVLITVSSQAFHLMSYDEFWTEFGTVFRSVFCLGHLQVRPFDSSEWPIFLVSGGIHMLEQEYRGLFEGAKACGDREMILTEVESRFPESGGMIIPVSYDAVQKAKYLSKSTFTILDTCLFGRSGRWGCICLASLDDVAVVAGDTTFAEAFVAAMGGADALRDNFLEFAATEYWAVGDEVRANLLRLAGW